MPSLLMVTTVASTLRGFLLPFAADLSARGWQVDAMARDVTSCPACVTAFRHVWNVAWARNPLDPRNLLAAPCTIREIVERERYDLVHVHTPVAGFVTRFALRRSRRRGGPKIIYTAHGFHFYRGGHPLRNLAFLALEKVAGRWTDHLVVINQEDYAAAQRYRLVGPGRVTLMAGIGVDTDYYHPDRVPEAQVAEVRASLGLAPTAPLYLVVAELIGRKCPEDALRAFARLPRRDAHLAFAGSGPLMEPLRTRAAQLGVQDRVHFLGSRADIPALVRAAAAVVLVSRQEGLPRSVMEALSLEVPVIGTDIRGTGDLLADGIGLLVPVGDLAQLVHAMTWVGEHPDEAKAMATKGRRSMQAAFGQPEIVRAHERLYAEAIGGSQPGLRGIPS